MISAAESTKQPSPPVFSLPPPCSYEDLYSSYQNEWDQQKTNGVTGSDNLRQAIVPDIDESVSGLEWVVLPGENGDNRSDTYLLACTSSGEILVWKLERSTVAGSNVDSTTDNKLDSAVLLKRHARLRIYRDLEDDDDSKALTGICIVRAATSNDGTEKSNQRGRKRQRPSDENETEHEVLLIVAGEGGLWSISLADILARSWGTAVTPSEPSSQDLPSSLTRLSSRPVQRIQTTSSESGEPQHLFVLERDTNMLCIWNLSAILENKCNRIGPNPETKMDLSRLFTTGVAGTSSKSKKKRRLQTRPGCSERATTISVITSLDNHKKDNLTLLVGTDRSRLWITPIPSGDIKEQEPHFLSLNEKKKEPSVETRTARGFSGRDSTSEDTWRVTDVIATNGGTWWTVAATSRDSNRNNTGLIMTWHAPTGMVVARQETREAIQAILEDQHLYSVANERAITVWDSSFGLKRSGRFWASPPSSKSLAILSESLEDTESGTAKSIMAVAGVGNVVDLFVDHCRVQTMQV